jgi:hypothetical protein
VRNGVSVEIVFHDVLGAINPALFQATWRVLVVSAAVCRRNPDPSCVPATPQLKRE